MVLADKTIVFLDGMQTFPADEMLQLREVFHNQRVIVTKKVSGSAPARCRVIAAANPRRSMKEYLDNCACLTDIASIAGISIELTRYDITISFTTEGVPRSSSQNREQVQYLENSSDLDKLPRRIFELYLGCYKLRYVPLRKNITHYLPICWVRREVASKCKAPADSHE